MEKKINVQLRKSIGTAEIKQYEANCALQQISKYIRFVGFEPENEPHLSMSSGYEIILEWKGYEVDKNHIISLMENVGYITPEDFFVE